MGIHKLPQEFKNNTARATDRRRFIIVGGLAGLLIILIGLSLVIGRYYSGKDTDAQKVATACESPAATALLKEATAPITNSNYDSAVKAAAKIQQLPKYEEDASCEYALVVHNINLGEPIKSRQHLEVLRKIYKPGQQLSAELGFIRPVDNLTANVVILEQQLEEIRKLAIPVSETPQ